VIFAAAIVACLHVAPESEAAPTATDDSTTTPRHYISVEVAPVFVAWWPGNDPDGVSDAFNLDPEGSRFSVGLNAQYGHRFSRHFELAGGIEYLRAPPFADVAVHHIRVTTTPFAVWGRGRPYDISLGARLGVSTLGVANSWVPQITTLAMLRQRVWLTQTVGLQLSGSAGLHIGLPRQDGKVTVPVMMEVFALHLGVAARF